MPDLATRRQSALIVALLALVASATSLANGFAYDDNSLIARSDRFHGLHQWWLRFAETYWPPILGRSLYRPLTTLAFSTEWAVGGGSPFAFHLANVLLYAACAVAVLALARQLLPSIAALCTAALFAVHPVHVEAVGNVVGQSELLAALAVLAGTTWYVRRRGMGSLSARDILIVAAAYLLGCLSKEGAIVFPALLIAAELTVLARNGEDLLRRGRHVLPTYAALFVVGVGELAIRRLVIGSWLGDYPVATLKALSTPDRVLTMIAASREWLRLFLWPVRLSMAYSPPYLPIIHGADARLLPGLAIVIGAFALLAISWKRAPVAAFGLLWLAIALLPVSNLIFVSGVFVAERTLFLPSVGLVLALGALADAVWSRARAAGRTEVVAASFAAVVLLAATRSAIRQRVWTDDAHVVTAAVQTLPDAYVVDALYAEYLGDTGAAGTAEKWLRRAITLYPADPQLYVDLGDLYSRNQQWDAARSMFSKAVSLDPALPSSRAGLVLAMVHDRDFEGARAQARIGVANGVAADDFRELLATIDRAEGKR